MKKIKPYQDKLKKLGVGVVYLFGSEADGTAGSLSDVDIGVVFEDANKLVDSSELYNQLYDIFTEIFNMSNFRNIDIIFLQKAPLELKFDVIRHGRVIYESSKDIRDNFEHNTSMLYIDYKPILDNFNRQILARI